MKKNIVKILVLMMTLCMVFSLASCLENLPFDLPFDIPGLTDGNNGDENQGGNTDENQNDNTNTGTNEKELVLIENKVAKFNVVYTAASSSKGKLVADKFVKQLRNLGITVNDAISDGDASKVTDCEIIIGADARNRGDDCCITTRYLGENGKSIKIVGKRIVIAAGTPDLVEDRFNWYLRNQLKITDRTKRLDNLIADATFVQETLTKYIIDSITVSGIDFRNYTYVEDVSGIDATAYDLSDIKNFREDLYSVSGYWLPLGEYSKRDTYDNCYIVRYVEDAGENGFRAYVEDGDFVVECAYRNSFNKAYETFVYNNFIQKDGDVVFADGFKSEQCVSIVYYEDYGANGADNQCDFENIYNTHIFANDGGQKVMSRLGKDANYIISADYFTKTIPVKTNVDFNGATFNVSDKGQKAYANRALGLFTFERDHTEQIFGDTIKDLEYVKTDGTIGYKTNGIIDDERFQGITISYDTTRFEWIVPYLQAKSLVRITNSLHKDFVRHGANQNSGNNRVDIFVVDIDGTISADTPVAYDFDNISEIQIFRTDDKPITMENGHFINDCCETVAQSDDKNIKPYQNDWQAYWRGLKIFRTNTTIKNVTHDIINEPEVGYYNPASGYKEDSLYGKFGSRYESYPYYGFFYIYDTYNFYAEDCQLVGHTVYYEDKPATASTGGSVPDPVAMGTYDLIVEYSSNVTLNNVDQKEPDTGLGDTKYWGIMSSNGAKNMVFRDCSINRFDAHRGFWNAELYDTVIGHSFQVVGGGYLYAENVTKLTKTNFMMLRGDYGATFRGDITLKDCTFEAYKSYNSARNGSFTLEKYGEGVLIDSGFEAYNKGYTTSADPYWKGSYWMWDFGYTCYLPINLTIDNFKTDVTDFYIYNDLPDHVFTSTYTDDASVNVNTVRNAYQVTETITYKNMKAIIPICVGTYQPGDKNETIDPAVKGEYTTFTYNKLNSIKINKVNIG